MVLSELRRLRKKSGKSLEDVGKSLGISRQLLSRIERGDTEVGLLLLSRILGEYGYELEVRGVLSRGGQRLEVRIYG